MGDENEVGSRFQPPDEGRMIERYTLPHMQSVWDLGHKYKIWLEVELLACEALEQGGKIPRGVAARIRRSARIDPERIAAIEKVEARYGGLPGIPRGTGGCGRPLS